MTTKQQNIPQLRFPEFSGEWEKKKLGEVAEVTAGGTPSTFKKEFWNGNIRWMNSGELNLKKVYEVENRITELGLKNSSTKILPKYCVMIGLAGQGKTRGTVAMNMVELCTNQSIGSIIPNHNFISEFLYQNLNNRYDELRNLSTGDGGRGGLNLSIIKSLEISFPSLAEQTKIANFFTAVDEKIQALKKKHSLLEQYKKGVMQRLFEHGSNGLEDDTDVEDNQKSVKSVNPKNLRFRQDDGSDFPKWEVKKLGEVFYSEKGKGISKNKIVEKGKFQCILYGELYTKYKEVIFEVESKTDENDGIKSKIGDLLIPSSTTTTGIDLANVTALNEDDVLLGGDITVLRSNEKVNNVFYAYYLSNHKKDEIASYAQGSTIVHLYYSHIKDMIIDVPCLAEQTKIANFLSALDEKISKTKIQIEKTEQWKKGLLQKMFV